MGHFLGSVDWIEVFAPQAPLLETFVRGSLLYLGLIVLLRLTPAREAGAVGTPDLLVVLLVGDGFALLVTILAWSVVLDWLGYRSAFFHRLLRTPPARLVRDGRILAAGLRRELMTRDELMAQLRKQGIEDVGQVKGAWIEADGSVSVIRRRNG
jgi:uncharacterized membrane protein YcaP (DUF421 family)